MTLKVALVGDYDLAITSHRCIPKALQISAENLNVQVEPIWLGTSEFDKYGSDWIADFDGVWCVPGSPYKNRLAAIEAIRLARTNNVPYLGTCGGYQHAILEFAINRLGYKDADLQEENPTASMPLISALSCRLTDEKRAIRILPSSKLSTAIGKSSLEEEYRCGFGMNPNYAHLFKESDLQFVAFNEEQIPQAFELTNHPFFVGTAFQPERSSRDGINHPLISTFVSKMIKA